LERAKALVEAGVDALVVDIAHVHSAHGMNAIKKIRMAFPKTDLIGGNIATPAAARDLIKLGCDALKVGIGPGGICITRIIAGVGVPQLTAIMQCAEIAHKYKIPVIADGGTNFPGDMTKALAAGASTVMLTGWLAGTDESPGSILLRNGQKYKVHRGAASFSAVASRKIEGVSGQVRKELAEEDLDEELEKVVAEGVETFIHYKGAVKDVIAQLVGALHSGMSYSNAKTIGQLWQNARFMEITLAGFRESKQHNVTEM
jgi:IMP dehydrogenase